MLATDIVCRPNNLRCDFYTEMDLKLFVEDDVYASEFNLKVHQYLGESPLDVLINNAAVQILGGISTLSRSDWNTTLAVNLIAPFLLIQAFLGKLEMGNGGVVNISSIHSRLTKKNFVAYSTSKAALSGMTRALAVDLGNRIRINTIEPAAIDTRMLRDGFDNSPDLFDGLGNSHPQGRIGQASEVANLALAIVDGGFEFMHGSCISLDGGIGGILNDPN